MIELKKAINKNDSKYFDRLYKISLYNYSNNYDLVYANNEQHALDTLIDHLEEIKENGYIYTYDQLLNDGLTELEIDINYISGGNYSNYVNVEHLNISEITQ